MKAQKDKREVSVGNQQEMYLPDKLEFLTEEMSEELMTLTDLSIVLEQERVRLDDIESDEQIPLEEIRVTYALLRVMCDKLNRLSKAVERVEGCFLVVLTENGLIPIVAKTWARSDSEPTTFNPFTSGSSLTQKQRAAKKAANQDQDHGSTIGADEL
jgi:hypothetical protein